MKIKKALFLSSFISLLPITTVVSCSSQQVNDSLTLDASILPAIAAKQIKLVATLNNPKSNEYKVNQLANSNVSYSLKVNSSEENNEYFSKLKEEVKHVSIKYEELVIPKIEDDENTSIILNLKYKGRSQDVYFKIKDIEITNQINLVNISANEIQTLIKEKTNSAKNFIQDFSFLISSNIDKLIKTQINKDESIQDFLLNLSSQDLYSNLSTNISWFLFQYKFFYIDYLNLYISPNSFTIIKDSTEFGYILKFKIFTSDSPNNSGSYYQLEIPFVINNSI